SGAECVRFRRHRVTKGSLEVKSQTTAQAARSKSNCLNELSQLPHCSYGLLDSMRIVGRIQWLFSPQVRRVVQRQGDGVTRPGADAKHPPLSKLAQARISRCRLKPWLATRSVPEHRRISTVFSVSFRR